MRQRKEEKREKSNHLFRVIGETVFTQFDGQPRQRIILS